MYSKFFGFKSLAPNIKMSLVMFQALRFSMINKVATTHCSFLRLQIKREDIIDKCRECDKDRSIIVYTILRDVCIVSNRLTCIDSKLSEMEILAQPLSLPFIIENLILAQVSMNSMNHFSTASQIHKTLVSYPGQSHSKNVCFW
jgi:hypothetical protein